MANTSNKSRRNTRSKLSQERESQNTELVRVILPRSQLSRARRAKASPHKHIPEKSAKNAKRRILAHVRVHRTPNIAVRTAAGVKHVVGPMRRSSTYKGIGRFQSVSAGAVLKF